MTITVETLRSILAEHGGIPMPDAEHAQVAPIVEAFVDEFSRLEDMDLSDTYSALQLRADDGGFSK